MHTQRQLSIEIVTAGGDYVWLAKDSSFYQVSYPLTTALTRLATATFFNLVLPAKLS